METFLYTLLGSAIVGLTVMAYKNPSGYGKLFPYLFGAITVVMLTGLGYNLGVTNARHAVFDYLDRAKLLEASSAMNRIELSYLWLLLGYMAAFAYLFFLAAGLPALLEQDKRN